MLPHIPLILVLSI